MTIIWSRYVQMPFAPGALDPRKVNVLCTILKHKDASVELKQHTETLVIDLVWGM